jgi:hypothetical protein
MNQKWLLRLTKQGIETETFPCAEVLEGSLYYPASGLDGSPIRHWSIGVDSFVYADMSVTQASYESELSHGAFRGYQLLASKQLHPADLTPAGWRVQIPTCLDGDVYQRLVVEALSDGTKPFAIWSVFERSPELNDVHGPQRFSLLYVRGEGCATYQALYNSNRVLPKVMALVRPGTGFGGNFGNFEQAMLEVMQCHPLGLPMQFLSWHSKRSLAPFENCIQERYPQRILGPLGKDGESDFVMSLFNKE